MFISDSFRSDELMDSFGKKFVRSLTRPSAKYSRIVVGIDDINASVMKGMKFDLYALTDAEINFPISPGLGNDEISSSVSDDSAVNFCSSVATEGDVHSNSSVLNALDITRPHELQILDEKFNEPQFLQVSPNCSPHDSQYIASFVFSKSQFLHMRFVIQKNRRGSLLIQGSPIEKAKVQSLLDPPR